jgi:hypothetical protein
MDTVPRLQLRRPRRHGWQLAALVAFAGGAALGERWARPIALRVVSSAVAVAFRDVSARYHPLDPGGLVLLVRGHVRNDAHAPLRSDGWVRCGDAQGRMPLGALPMGADVAGVSGPADLAALATRFRDAELAPGVWTPFVVPVWDALPIAADIVLTVEARDPQP